MDVMEELSAPEDRIIRFRLKQPFPLLPAALGKPGSPVCAMMPERLDLEAAKRALAESVTRGSRRWCWGRRISPT
jgi:peptide/nickel transport system substrate-binding protein